MSNFDLVIFDNDGVLVDSVPVFKKAQLLTFTEAGYPVDEKWLYKHTLGADFKTLNDLMIKNFNKPISAETDKMFYQNLDKCGEELEAISGVSLLLEELKIPYCLATNGMLTSQKLEWSGLNKYFSADQIFTVDNEFVKKAKPAPDLFLHAAKVMGCIPKKCLVVEDTVIGVQAAKAAGMKVVGFKGAAHYKHIEDYAQQLLDAGADMVIEDIRELLEIVK